MTSSKDFLSKRPIGKFFPAYAWFYLVLNLIVILGGAVVRATNSGAGCGAYWPLCQGNVLPNLTAFHTVIEFIHRVSSAVVGVGAILLFIGAWLIYPKKHMVRIGAAAVLIFVLLEGLLGAGLVLFGLVERNLSFARLCMVGLHLTNTFLLIGAATLTASWASGLTTPKHISFSRHTILCKICLLLLLVTGAMGAMTALSDLHFRPEYVGQHLWRDLTTPSHVLQILRVIHPLLAVLTSFFLAIFVIKSKWQSKKEHYLAYLVLSLIGIQILMGLMNLAFLTPILLQLIHLFFADLLWISTILFISR